MGDDEIVRSGTRRVVGREALRRLSRLVQGWQQEEQEKAELTKRLFAGIVIVTLVGLGLFHWFYR